MKWICKGCGWSDTVNTANNLCPTCLRTIQQAERFCPINGHVTENNIVCDSCYSSDDSLSHYRLASPVGPIDYFFCAVCLPSVSQNLSGGPSNTATLSPAGEFPTFSGGSHA